MIFIFNTLRVASTLKGFNQDGAQKAHREHEHENNLFNQWFVLTREKTRTLKKPDRIEARKV